MNQENGFVTGRLKEKLRSRLDKALRGSKGVKLSGDDVFTLALILRENPDIPYGVVMKSPEEIPKVDPSFDWGGWEDELVGRFPEDITGTALVV